MGRDDFLSSAWKDDLFADRVVFCTGGAGTICSAQVRALVYLGANACIIGRNVDKTERVAADIATARPGARVLGIGGVDVRSMDSLESAVSRCVDTLGQIDYVIAGAAGNFLAPISGLSSNAFRTVLEIDTLGSYNTLKATLPHLLASAARNNNHHHQTNPGLSSRTGGRIVFVSATFHLTGMPLQAHVAAAKAGVDALSATAALEYGPGGLTSNVISPGGIRGTEGLERLSTKAAREGGLAARAVPLQRLGEVKDIADATIYLFAETGNYVNGLVLVVDGGAWRLPAQLLTMSDAKYPENIHAAIVSDVKTGRKAKL